MILRDEVTFRSRLISEDATRPKDMTVPAMVYTVTGEHPLETNRPGLLVRELRAIVPGELPRPIDPVNDDCIHKGYAYRVDGPPLGRYRAGRIHHWTVNLWQSEG